jgi:hypothetical protein
MDCIVLKIHSCRLLFQKFWRFKSWLFFSHELQGYKWIWCYLNIYCVWCIKIFLEFITSKFKMKIAQ